MFTPNTLFIMMEYKILIYKWIFHKNIHWTFFFVLTEETPLLLKSMDLKLWVKKLEDLMSCYQAPVCVSYSSAIK